MCFIVEIEKILFKDFVLKMFIFYILTNILMREKKRDDVQTHASSFVVFFGQSNLFLILNFFFDMQIYFLLFFFLGGLGEQEPSKEPELPRGGQVVERRKGEGGIGNGRAPLSQLLSQQ